MQEEKVEAYARKHEMEHLTYYVELSIIKLGGTIYLGITSDIQVDHKNLKDLFTKMVLSLGHQCWIEALKVL